MRTLENKIIAAIVLSLLLLEGVLIYFTSVVFEPELRSEQMTRQMEFVDHLVTDLDQKMNDRVELLNRLANAVEKSKIRHPGYLQGVLAKSLSFQDKFDLGILAVGLDGIAIAEYPVLGRVGRDYSDTAHFKAALQTGRPSYSTPRMGTVSKKPIVVMTYPVKDSNGTIVMVLSGVMDLTASDFFGPNMAGLGKAGTTEFYVISMQDQLMIAAPDPSRILTPMPRIGQSEINDRFTQGFVGSAVGMSSRGIEKLYSGKRMSTTGWLVELALPTNIAFRPATLLVRSIYLISICSVVVTILFMKGLITYLLSPLRTACSKLDEMSSERVPLSELDASGDREVSQLLTSFNRLINLLDQRNEKLLTSEHVYRSLIDNMLNGLAYCQMLYKNGEPVDFIYLNVNRAFEKLTGLTGVIGKKVTDVIPGVRKYDAQLIELYGRVAATGIPEQHDHFLSSLNQWFRLSVYCTAPGYFAVVFDNITERVRDEDNLRLAATAFEVDEAIVVTDANGTILRINQAASLTSGYTAEEVQGKSTRLFKSGHHDDSFYKFMWHSLLTKGRWEGEIWDRRKSGEIYPKWLKITCVKNLKDVVTHYIGSYHEITDQKNSEAKLLRLNQSLSEKKAQLREFAFKNDAKLEHERKHIAREVHDELGQILTALRMDISFLSLRFGQTDPELKTKVMSMRATVDSAIQGVRNVASNLRPLAMDMGIFLALDWLCQDFTKRTGVACILDAKEKDVWLDDARAIVVFRIVQESLTNISRYAEASQVLVTVGLDESLLGVEVQDDGKGFDPMTAEAKKTFGLLGMRERALALGGRLDVVSSPGQGTTVSLSVPIDRRIEGAER